MKKKEKAVHEPKRILFMIRKRAHKVTSVKRERIDTSFENGTSK